MEYLVATGVCIGVAITLIIIIVIAKSNKNDPTDGPEWLKINWKQTIITSQGRNDHLARIADALEKIASKEV